jgi:hypothetical protein
MLLICTILPRGNRISRSLAKGDGWESNIGAKAAGQLLDCGLAGRLAPEISIDTLNQ